MDLTQFTKLSEIFDKLCKRPDKSDEIAVILRDTLNSIFDDKIDCKRVFISKGNGTDPYYVSVIPNKPTNKILKTKFLKDYDIDIDITSFTNKYNTNGLTTMEMAAWLLHEIAANLLTDETLLRFKKLIVKYYDIKQKGILDTVDAYGIMLWIGIFSRTKKIFSDDKLSEVNILIKKWNISEYWDSALSKYISANGGDMYKLTDEYIERMDKSQLREFNELARKYSSYALKYNNTDYSTMVKYIISTTNSQLVKYYIEKEPQSVPTNPEKNVFLLFDDSKILLESVDPDNISLDQITSVDLLKKYRELKEDIDTIESQSDKLLCSAKLKELSRLVDDKFETDGSSDILQQLKFDIESLSEKLINKETSEKVSMVELE